MLSLSDWSQCWYCNFGNNWTGLVELWCVVVVVVGLMVYIYSINVVTVAMIGTLPISPAQGTEYQPCLHNKLSMFAEWEQCAVVCCPAWPSSYQQFSSASPLQYRGWDLRTPPALHQQFLFQGYVDSGDFGSLRSKKPFCNAFTGCGRKRSDPTMAEDELMNLLAQRIQGIRDQVRLQAQLRRLNISSYNAFYLRSPVTATRVS